MKTKIEYVKVTDSIFDLRLDFERGELYCKHASNDSIFIAINGESKLLECYLDENVYTKVETHQSWQDVAAECLGMERYRDDDNGFYTSSGQYFKIEDGQVEVLLNGRVTENQLIKMCHEVAAITEKPE